ncbi:PTS sugar transporter subunit IIA [Sediminibacillus albus]|uniref:Mannitol-specific phosphotransferase enzyme IIA component n=1 Tax=Sediminibacillus albus TaxID=407036 RepID=A0A1G8WTF6_9BACI|nr:PTS sugar transporter subunit IIA [Sediminibacillus albus]SDJ81423.1 PTS system, mannitol-specific IIA component [Sediminibacillus albus]
MAKEILTKDNVDLNASVNGKEEAIRYTGNILVKNGYVEEAYVDKMLEREEVTSTFIGNNVAIPHGTEDAKKAVKETGLSVVTVPEGIDFGGGNVAKVLIGIAGKGDEHLEILSKIALVCSEEENIQKILDAQSADDILNMFEEVN